jgi:hypothetical protein
MSDLSKIFGEPIYIYSRKDALADGVQVDVSTMATEAGITFPTFMTHTVWDTYVKVPEGVTAQDEKGRLWDILWMLRHHILAKNHDPQRLTFQLFVRNDNRRAKLVTLAAECGPMDFDDPRPCITITVPGED